MTSTVSETRQRPQGIGVLLALFGLLLAIIAGSIIWIMANADTGEDRPWSKPAINGTEITVQFQAACVDTQGMDVKETSSSVTLTLSVAEETCNSEPTTHTAVAVLKGSFNARQLIDGACLTDKFRGSEACSIESHEPISNTGLKKKVADPTAQTSTEPSATASAS